MKRQIGAVLAVLLLSTTACGGKNRQEVTPVSAPPGSFGVGVVTTEVTSDAAAGRTFPTMVFYPAQTRSGLTAEQGAAAAASEGPFPLVVFAHGAGTGPQTYQPLIESIASRGYVVAAPVFPDSSSPDIVGTQLAQQLAEPQALDVAAVVERVRSQGIGGIPIASLLTPGELHLVGHSLGAATVLTAAYNTCCRLPEVTSVSAVSALRLPTSGEFEFSGTSLEIVHGVQDDVIPIEEAEQIYELAEPPKFLFKLETAGHFEFVLPTSPNFGAVVLAIAAHLEGTTGGGTTDAAAMEEVAAISDSIELLADP